MIAIIERKRLLKELMNLYRLTNSDVVKFDAREPSLFITMDNRTVILKADIQKGGSVKANAEAVIDALKQLDGDNARLSAHAGVYLDIYSGNSCKTVAVVK